MSPERRAETKKTNIGRVIILCEDKTEKYYFDYFAEIIKINKYTDVEVVLETTNGNAQTVPNLANRFMAEEENNRIYNAYGPYSKGHKWKTRELVQNGEIEKAINNAKSLEQRYETQGKTVFANIKEMNPYTSVHKLIEQFMVEISG